jgi:hypothetical protein
MGGILFCRPGAPCSSPIAVLARGNWPSLCPIVRESHAQFARICEFYPNVDHPSMGQPQGAQQGVARSTVLTFSGRQYRCRIINGGILSFLKITN